MKIGVDLDGVLGQTIPAVIEYHNTIHGTNLTLEQFHSNNYWEVWGGTREEAIQEVHNFYETPYFKNIKPVIGARESLKTLKKNNELFIVTSRQNKIIPETKEWVEKYFPNIFSEMYFTNHFTQNGDTKTKKEVCDSLNVDVLIEDVVEYAVECVTAKRKIFLLDYPWNRDAVLPEGIQRVYSWEEIIEEIGN